MGKYMIKLITAILIKKSIILIKNYKNRSNGLETITRNITFYGEKHFFYFYWRRQVLFNYMRNAQVNVISFITKYLQ